MTSTHLLEAADTISSLSLSKLSRRNVRKMFAASTVATPLKVDIQVIVVTGLSECCNNFKHVLLVTSHTRTMQPAALKARGEAKRTFVTGPECPVRVQTGVEGEPERLIIRMNLLVKKK